MWRYSCKRRSEVKDEIRIRGLNIYIYMEGIHIDFFTRIRRMSFTVRITVLMNLLFYKRKIKFFIHPILLEVNINFDKI